MLWITYLSPLNNVPWYEPTIHPLFWSSPVLILALSFLHVSYASTPKVNFERMGKVGLASACAGLGFFNGSPLPFDPTTSTFSCDEDGTFTQLASTTSGDRTLAGCALWQATGTSSDQARGSIAEASLLEPWRLSEMVHPLHNSWQAILLLHRSSG